MNDENEIINQTVQDDEDFLPPAKSWQKEVLDWTFSIILAIVIALVIRNYVFTLVNVSGSSMIPTLSHGDKLYVNKFMYSPENGDIVILKPPQDPKRHYVKRVIALPGQVVDIDEITQTVSIDGNVLEEDYTTGPTFNKGGAVEYPYTVKEGEVFVLGDNRTPGGSSDSRTLGPIPEKNIEGKVIFRIFPFSKFGSVYK